MSKADFDTLIDGWFAAHTEIVPVILERGLGWFQLADEEMVGELELVDESTPTPGTFERFLRARSRFIMLSESLAQIVAAVGLDPSPYHDLLGNLEGASEEAWNAARTLTKRLQTRAAAGIIANSPATLKRSNPQAEPGDPNAIVARLKPESRKALVLQVLYEADGQRMTAEEITPKAFGPDADANNTKGPITSLAKDGLVETRSGPRGGCSITAAGKRAHERLIG